MLEVDRVVAVVSEVIPKGPGLYPGNDRAQVAASDEFGLCAQGVGGEILPQRVVGGVRSPTTVELGTYS